MEARLSFPEGFRYQSPGYTVRIPFQSRPIFVQNDPTPYEPTKGPPKWHKWARLFGVFLVALAGGSAAVLAHNHFNQTAYALDADHASLLSPDSSVDLVPGGCRIPVVTDLSQWNGTYKLRGGLSSKPAKKSGTFATGLCFMRKTDCHETITLNRQVGDCIYSCTETRTIFHSNSDPQDSGDYIRTLTVNCP